MTTALSDFALKMAEHGVRVFPLQNSGDPIDGVSWLPLRTRNPDKIRAQLKSRSAYGCATGDGILVVDVDSKDGEKGGPDLFDELDMVYGFPDTFTVKSKSGGKHLYYRVPASLQIKNDNKGKVLGPGIDIKGRNGYVVGPGSEIGGRPYTIERDVAFAEAPQWLLDRCERDTERPENTAEPLVAWDIPANVDRAKQWLLREAKPALQGEHGDTMTVDTAKFVRDFAVSEPVCLELMLDHYNERCEPPWDPEELAVKVANGYRYADRPPGTQESGVAQFGDASEFLENRKKESRIYWLRTSEACRAALEQVNEPLIDGLLDQGALSMLYGASNSGKTFLMLDFAYHIAAGLPWEGREVSQGLVVYVAAEGGRGILKRVKALVQKHGVKDPPLAIVPCSVNLLSSKADIEAVIAAVRDAASAYNAPIRWLVVDTLSRALAGGDEHGPTDMGAFIKNLDFIRGKLKTALGVVHHTGKNEALGARGWSGMQAAVDTEIEIGKSSQTISVTKQRDLEPIPDMRFKLERSVVGRDPKGREVATCTVRVLKNNEFVIRELTPNEEAAFAALVRCAEKSKQEAISSAFWLSEMISIGPLAKYGKKTLRNLMASLVATGKVKKPNKDQYVIPAMETMEIVEK